MTGAELTPWIPSNKKGRRARTPLARVWCSVRQYAYHDMHSLRIAPGRWNPFRFSLKPRAAFLPGRFGFCGQDGREMLRPKPIVLPAPVICNLSCCECIAACLNLLRTMAELTSISG